MTREDVIELLVEVVSTRSRDQIKGKHKHLVHMAGRQWSKEMRGNDSRARVLGSMAYSNKNAKTKRNILRSIEGRRSRSGSLPK